MELIIGLVGLAVLAIIAEAIREKDLPDKERPYDWDSEPSGFETPMGRERLGYRGRDAA